MYIKDVKIERNSFDNKYIVFIKHCSLHISIKYDVFSSSYIIRYYDIDERLINNWEIDEIGLVEVYFYIVHHKQV